MAQFTIYQRRDGQYAFHLSANNGEVILTSEGFSSKIGLENTIQTVRKSANTDSNYIRIDNAGSSGGGYSFQLKAQNGQIIGMSDRYVMKDMREQAIELLKHIAESAYVVK